MRDYVVVADMKGLTLASVVVVTNNPKAEDSVTFNTVDGKSFRMYHSQDCCENVVIEDVTGDIEDLIGSPLVMSEEINNTDWDTDGSKSREFESVTWTFYKFATVKGYVTLRWCGTSNGYYSESVSFCEI